MSQQQTPNYICNSILRLLVRNQSVLLCNDTSIPNWIKKNHAADVIVHVIVICIARRHIFVSEWSSKLHYYTSQLDKNGKIVQ